MPVPLRLRLFWNSLLVTATGMLLAAVLAWLAVEDLYLETQRQNLLAQARLAAATFQGSPLPLDAVEPYAQTANIAPGIHTRILSEQGGVLISPQSAAGEANIQVPSAEQAGFVPAQVLLQREEIQQALQGQAATAVRRIASAGGRRVLYAAAPVPDAGGGIAGIVYLATPLPRSRLPAHVILQFIGAGLAAILLASLAASLLSRRIAGPIENLNQAAQAISQGDLGQKVPVAGKVRELQNLGQAFNQMSDSLQQSTQARNAFIADVTHELRTPLTVIKGTTETLQDGALDDLEGRGPLLDSMQGETDRLIRLVNDLLVLTRADASALQLNIASLDLADLARSRCQQLAPLAAERGLTLQVEPGEGSSGSRLWVEGDGDRLAQVFDNLLDNAIRHTPPGAAITIRIRSENGKIHCAVHNPGPGIPAQHLPYLFERFYRVDPSRDRKSGGAGLGLAIVHALVSAHGGEVDVESSPGEGVTFAFWLPRGDDAQAAGGGSNES